MLHPAEWLTKYGWRRIPVHHFDPTRDGQSKLHTRRNRKVHGKIAVDYETTEKSVREWETFQLPDANMLNEITAQPRGCDAQAEISSYMIKFIHGI